MEFDHLKGFYFVAKLGSFTEAADRLFLTQPAISIQVKALERELGERLFIRAGRISRLTPAGTILFQRVEGLMAKLEEVQDAVKEIQRLERGCLTVGASDTTSIYFLPEILQAFLRAHPMIDLAIRSVLTRQVVRMVLDRELDLGIITVCSVAPQLQVIPLFDQRLVCITSPGHPLASRSTVELAELTRERLVLLEKGSVTRDRIDHFLLLAGHSPRPVMELSNFEIIKRYVSVGLGVSLIPEAATRLEGDRISAIPLAEPLTLEIGIVLREDRHLSHAARAFLDIAHASFQGGAPAPAPGLEAHRN